MDWFKEKISEPFKTWAKRAGDRVNAIKEGIKGWIDGFKETIVEGFNKYIKEPVANAVKPVSDAVGGAWSSIKQSFQPIVDLFNAWKKDGISGAIKALNADGSGAYDEVNAEEDNLRSGAKPGDNIKAIKPIQHNISSRELLKPINNTTNNSNTTNQTSNKFVFYSQSDARWSKTKIGNSNMKDAGCGPTSMAMAISQLTGEQITPDTVAKLGQEHLPGYSKYSLFPSIANKLNMNYVEGHDAGFISNNLRKGLPVILSGKTGISGTPFTSEGHVVTATHMMGNKVYINDPRGEAYSGYYPISSVMPGLTKGMVLTPSNRTDVSKLSSGSIDSLTTPENMQKENAKAIAELAAAVLDNKKGLDVTLLEVSDQTILADYFVLSTGTANTHVRALADEFADAYVPLDALFAKALLTQPEPLYYSVDAVHPNENGARFIAAHYVEAIAPLIERL
jgi:hypothetical protein